MPAFFSDNMVLQQGVPVPVRGWAAPDEKVAVEFAGQRKETAADGAGKWQVRLDPLTVTASPSEMQCRRTERSRDPERAGRRRLAGLGAVQHGDACAERGERRSRNGGSRPSRHPVLHVEHDLASSPKDDCAGKWVTCEPKSVGPFSAVAYFFARELHRKYKLPMGIINSSVGASSCQAWTPAEVLTADKTLPQLADVALENYTSWKTYLAYRNGVYDHSSYADTGISPECQVWAKPDFGDADWKDFKAPGNIEAQGMAIDGAVWFRKTVEVPAEWAGQALTLSLGPISDNDVTFMNGARVGATENNWREWVFRNYSVPGKLVKSGRNVIAVRIFNRIGNGGFYPVYPAPLRLAKDAEHAVILSGMWEMQGRTRRKAPRRCRGPLPSVYSVPAAFVQRDDRALCQVSAAGLHLVSGRGQRGCARNSTTRSFRP